MKKRFGIVVLGMGLFLAACGRKEAQDTNEATDSQSSMVQDIGDAATVETNPNLSPWSAQMEEIRGALSLELGDQYRPDRTITEQDLQNEYQVNPAWITDYMGETSQNKETIILLLPKQEDDERVWEALQESVATAPDASPDENDDALQAQIVRIGRYICYANLGENNAVVITLLEELVAAGN
ncbi:MAG: DUF4358 domain-containing protein [Clostridium sp.]|nr:DUF4358 domain-containing protein [Clostridium sp.]